MRSGPAAILSIILTIAFLFALTGYQVTGSTAGPRFLGRLAAAMVELDRWIPAHQEDLAEAGRDRATGVIPVRDLPIQVNLPAWQVADAEQNDLRVAISAAMGQQLYDQGSDAFVSGEGETASLSFVEPARWTTSLLNSSMNTLWLIALAATGLLLLLMCGLIVARGSMPFMAIAIGAVIAALGSLAGWAIAQILGSSLGTTIDREIMLIARDGAWLGFRNSAALAVAAGVLFFLIRAVGSHSSRNWDPAPAEEPYS